MTDNTTFGPAPQGLGQGSTRFALQDGRQRQVSETDTRERIAGSLVRCLNLQVEDEQTR